MSKKKNKRRTKINFNCARDSKNNLFFSFHASCLTLNFFLTFKKENVIFVFIQEYSPETKKKKKEKIEIKQTLKISFIFVYTIFHPRNGSIHPTHSPSLHTQDETDGMDAREQSKKRTNGQKQLRCNGELGANSPLDLKGSQVENRFSKFERGKCSPNKRKRVYPSKAYLVEDYHSRVTERKSGF